MSTPDNILSSILNKDLSKVPLKDSQSLLEDFPNKQQITEMNELRLMQIILARQAIIAKASHLAEQLSTGTYLASNKADSKWILYKLNDGTDRIGVHWSHFDDDSWSVYFKGDNLEIESLYYEN